MGIVLTQEQVCNGEIPNIGDQEKMARLILGLVDPSGPLVAGMVYGSTVYGHATRRSDTDVLMVFRAEQEAAAEVLLRKTIWQANNAGIFAPVEDHLEDDVQRPLSSFDDVQYHSHLVRTAHEKPEWVAGNPLRYFEQQELTEEIVLGDAFGFVKAKIAKFRHAGRREEFHANSLQRALELPSNIGRKVFSVLSMWEELQFDTVDKRSMKDKAEAHLILSGERGLAGAEKTLKQHRLLRSLDDEYSQLIDDIVEGKESTIRHREWLKGNYHHAIQTARACSYGWLQVLDMTVADVHMVQSR